jgi:hypothetical protein
MGARYMNAFRIVLVFLICLSVTAGCNSNSPKPVTNTKPADSIALSLADFPEDWQLLTSNENGDDCYRKFANSDFTIECSVHVYKTIKEAKKQFDLKSTDYAKRFVVTKLTVGEQAFSIETISRLLSTMMLSIFFIKNNVTVELDVSAELYGVTQDGALVWANKIASKID